MSLDVNVAKSTWQQRIASIIKDLSIDIYATLHTVIHGVKDTL